jgi:hypothetical protein
LRERIAQPCCWIEAIELCGCQQSLNSWPVAYGEFTLGMFFIGFAAYHTLRYFEQLKTKQLLAARRRKEG